MCSGRRFDSNCSILPTVGIGERVNCDVVFVRDTGFVVCKKQ
jgi:hypothetical protein